MKLKPKSKVLPRSKGKSAAKLATGLLSATLLLSAVSPAIAFAAGTTAPIAASISVVNNKAGVKDTVKVTGLEVGDIINVYNTASAGTLLGTATVAADATEATVQINQIGSGTGSVYVTVTRGENTESSRTAKAFDSETSAALNAAAITVTNEATGTDDTVKVTGLAEGDEVTVYGRIIASAVVGSGETEVTVEETDLLTATGGTAQISVTRYNKLESAKVTKTYGSEPVTSVPLAANITVDNFKTGVNDKVTVKNLVEGDIVSVYKAATGGTAIGTATVEEGETEATVSIEQLGTVKGSVYVSLKSEGKLESARVLKAYDTDASPALVATAITVTNGPTGKDDTVVVTGLAEGDVVSVYGVVTGGTALATATVEEDETEATVTKADMLTATGGNVYVSVTKKDKLESTRLVKAYATETVSTAPVAANIAVSNFKTGVSDEVKVSGLAEGDVVNVYKAATGGTPLGTATVEEGETDAAVSIAQLGTAAGTLYVSVKSEDKLESVRTSKAFESEASAAPVAGTITITNNGTSKDDTVEVTGLAEGDVVKVYSVATGGTALETATVEADETSVTITKADLLVAKGGTLYVSVTKVNKTESVRTAKTYVTEPVTTAPLAANISVDNFKVGVSDTVKVTNLVEGDVVNVYGVATGGTVLGTATVEEGETDATITIVQLGIAKGSVYVSVRNDGKMESVRVAKAYDAEASTALLATAITVTNNGTSKDDTVEVTGLAEGDVVKVYGVATGGTALETATVEEGETSVTITKADLLVAKGGTLYVTVTKLNKTESTRTAKTYATEPVTTAPVAANITVVNNKAGVNDTVKVTNLVEGDVVSVYSVATGGTALGTATVEESETDATVSITQLGTAKGNVYVSVRSDGKMESTRVLKAYDADASAALLATAITVTNNVTGTEDTVKVTGLAEGDVISVYSVATGGTAIATATVEEGETEVTISEENLLVAKGGTVYVAIAKENKAESTRTAKTYLTEPVSTAPVATKITVVNNKLGVDDTVTVTDLVEGDIVKVYSVATGGTAIGTATVEEGETEAVVEIEQLGTAKGNVYVTVTNEGKLESARILKAYDADASPALVATAITVTNNGTGKEDTVKVTGLAEGDVVSVYSAATGGTALETGTVEEGETEVTISKVDLLNAAGGTVYVTVAKGDKAESIRTAKTYAVEPSTPAPALATITVTNNKDGVNDTVEVTGLVAGDIVYVYKAAAGGTALVSGTVEEDETSIKVSIAQLGAAKGTVYVSVKSDGMKESLRTAAAYETELTAPALATNIVVLNNDGEDDIVRVTGLKEGDVVKVYDAATGGTVIGTATVADGKLSVNVKIAQISTGAGKVYITITRGDKVESIRVVKDYIAE